MSLLKQQQQQLVRDMMTNFRSALCAGCRRATIAVVVEPTIWLTSCWLDSIGSGSHLNGVAANSIGANALVALGDQVNREQSHCLCTGCSGRTLTKEPPTA